MRLSDYMECQSLSHRTGILDYGTHLEEFPEGHRDVVDDNEHRFCFSIDRWSVRDDHTGFRGHAASMRLGS